MSMKKHTFKQFDFGSEIQEAISIMGFETPTAVQEKAIPVIQKKSDVIACAQTGTGKTAAYLLPLLDQVGNDPGKGIQVLIIVPTRELAMQIDQQIQGFSYYLPVSSIAVYGGSEGDTWNIQRKGLSQGTDFVVATPGRLLSHISMKNINFSKLQHLVLDEADRMLDMGFQQDILKIITKLPKKRQTLLFSATMPAKIRTFAKKILNKPEEIDIAISKPAEQILQAAYLIYDNQKIDLLKYLLKDKDMPSILIFSSTKKNVSKIRQELSKLNFKTQEIHSDLDQKERETVLLDFKNRKFQILVATDILSRGIDIEDIDLIINYDIPQDPEDYVHRVGRTARAASAGMALSFINPADQNQFYDIEKLIDEEIRKVPLPPELGESFEYNPRRKSKKKSYYRKKTRKNPPKKRR